jgi:hypothetical protein
MLLIFTLFVTQIYDTYDQQFAVLIAVPDRKKATAGTEFWPPFRSAAKRSYA